MPPLQSECVRVVSRMAFGDNATSPNGVRYLLFKYRLHIVCVCVHVDGCLLSYDMTCATYFRNCIHTLTITHGVITVSSFASLACKSHTVHFIVVHACPFVVGASGSGSRNER